MLTFCLAVLVSEMYKDGGTKLGISRIHQQKILKPPEPTRTDQLEGVTSWLNNKKTATDDSLPNRSFAHLRSPVHGLVRNKDAVMKGIPIPTSSNRDSIEPMIPPELKAITEGRLSGQHWLVEGTRVYKVVEETGLV